MLQVDVFEHHRFCDEFSHLVLDLQVSIEHFVGSAGLINVINLLSSEFNQLNVQDVVNDLSSSQINHVNINQFFQPFNECLK